MVLGLALSLPPNLITITDITIIHRVPHLALVLPLVLPLALPLAPVLNRIHMAQLVVVKEPNLGAAMMERLTEKTTTEPIAIQ
jgi:hypothetical protein